jgi:hypothetical protein
MELPFTHKPGRRERHLRRRHENPLFGWPPPEVDPEELLAAQKADHEEMESFVESFRSLVQKAVDLEPNAGSEQVLGLKEALERHYEQACGLPGDHRREKEAIKRLVAVIMRAIWRSAGDDPLAQRELEDEEQARVIHLGLLEHPLVADILHPESPIAPNELVASLLTAREGEVAAALEMFDLDQLSLLVADGRSLIERIAAEGVDVSGARRRLALLEVRRTQLAGGRTIN